MTYDDQKKKQFEYIRLIGYKTGYTYVWIHEEIKDVQMVKSVVLCDIPIKKIFTYYKKSLAIIHIRWFSKP